MINRIRVDDNPEDVSCHQHENLPRPGQTNRMKAETGFRSLGPKYTNIPNTSCPFPTIPTKSQARSSGVPVIPSQQVSNSGIALPPKNPNQNNIITQNQPSQSNIRNYPPHTQLQSSLNKSPLIPTKQTEQPQHSSNRSNILSPIVSQQQQQIQQEKQNLQLRPQLQQPQPQPQPQQQQQQQQ